MKPDLYTKVVLTVIAASLTALAVDTFEPKPASASAAAVDVNIVAIAGERVKYPAIGGAKGALPITTGVDIIGQPLPVEVVPKR